MNSPSSARPSSSHVSSALHRTRSNASETAPAAVLFDLDGTLIDSIELILNSARYAFEKRSRPCPSDAEWLTGVGTPLVAMFGRYAADEGDTAVFIEAYREYQMANHDRLVRGYDDVAATLGGLHDRGHPIAVVTSKSVALALRGLSHVGIAPMIETVVGCDSCLRHKPDPEPVRIALERLGYPSSNAVFVGDSVHDVLAGNAAGVTTIAALWGPFSREQLEPSKPVHYLERIRDLPQLLRDLRG
jgi:pyrophosphatase PpaX